MENWFPGDYFRDGVDDQALRVRIEEFIKGQPSAEGASILQLKPSTPSDTGVLAYKDPLYLWGLAQYYPDQISRGDIHIVEPRWSYWRELFDSRYSVAPLLSAGFHMIVLVSTLEERTFFQRQGIPHLFPMGGGSWLSEEVFYPLEREKTFDVCMVAAVNMPDEVKRWRAFMEMVGRLGLKAVLLRRGPERALDDATPVAEAERLGVHRQVAIVNRYLNRTEMNQVYNISRFYTLLSYREGFNGSFAEALLAGCPALVQTNSISVPPHVMNDQTGFYIDPLTIRQEDFKQLVELSRIMRPREWALDNLCATASTKRLNEFLSAYCTANALPWQADAPVHCNNPRKKLTSVRPTYISASSNVPEHAGVFQKIGFVLATYEGDRPAVEQFLLEGFKQYAARGHSIYLGIDEGEHAFDDLAREPGFYINRTPGASYGKHMTNARLLSAIAAAIAAGCKWIVKVDSDSAFVHINLEQELASFDPNELLQLGTPKEITHVQGGGMIFSAAAMRAAWVLLEEILAPGGHGAEGPDDVLLGDAMYRNGILPQGVKFVHCFWKKKSPVPWDRTCIVHSTKDESLKQELMDWMMAGGRNNHH